MKKLLTAALLAAFASAVSFAAPAQAVNEPADKAAVAAQRKAASEEMKREKKALEELGKKYKQAPEAEKPAIETQINDALGKSYDKKIAKMESNLAEAKKPEAKQKYIASAAKKLTGVKKQRGAAKKAKNDDKKESGTKNKYWF